MMSVTHSVLAVGITSVMMGTADSGYLLAAAIAAQLPDLDSTKSIVGRVLWPLAKFLEERSPHRGLTHSFLATTVVTVVTFFVCWRLGLEWKWVAAIGLGYFVGWFSDAFTKSGVCAFWPNQIWLVIPGNPNARLRSGGSGEYWVLAVATALTILSINVASAGGISFQFQQSFFRDTGTAVEVFRRDGARRLVEVTVKGQLAATGQDFSGRYEVLADDGINVLIFDPAGDRLLKVGLGGNAQVKPLSIKVAVGDPLQIQSQAQDLQEVSVTDWLRNVPLDSWVSGSLLLDDATLVQIQAEPGEYPPIEMSGQSLRLDHARVTDLQAIAEEWVLQGSVVIKTRLKEGDDANSGQDQSRYFGPNRWERIERYRPALGRVYVVAGTRNGRYCPAI